MFPEIIVVDAHTLDVDGVRVGVRKYVTEWVERLDRLGKLQGLRLMTKEELDRIEGEAEQRGYDAGCADAFGLGK